MRSAPRRPRAMTARRCGCLRVCRGEIDALRIASWILPHRTPGSWPPRPPRRKSRHRPGVKAARHHARDELRGHALHDLVTGGDTGQERLSGGTGRLGGGERGRHDRGAGMGQHAERVPLAAGKDRLGIDEGSAGLGQLRAMAQHGRRAAAALLLLHDRKRLPARRHVMRHERRGQRLQCHALGAVDEAGGRALKLRPATKAAN